MSDHSDELSRILAGLEQFDRIDLIAAGSDTADSLNSFLDRLNSLGYDVEEFRITDNDYKMVGSLDSRRVMQNPKPHLKYGVLQRKHGALMKYFSIRERAIIVDTSLPRKIIH